MPKDKQAAEPVRVLIADDDPSVRRVLAEYLRGSGIDVFEAGDGRDALELVRRELPALVVLDIDMPELSGKDVCRAMRAESTTSAIPVIVVTGLSGMQDHDEILASGANDLIAKPVRKYEFVARVRNQLAVQDARRQLEAVRRQQDEMRTARLRKLFERYLAPRVVERVLSSGEFDGRHLLTEHRKCDAAVLFADLRGFTPMSEQLEPETVVRLLNEFFAVVVRSAHRYDGTVISMAGDCMMIAFNVPVDLDNPALRAVKTGMRVIADFPKLAGRWHSHYGVQTGVGVGINAGTVVAGNVGSPRYMNYTLIGDTVNVASRLTARARAGEILYTDSVARWIGAPVTAATRLGPLQIRGKAAPVPAYCIPSACRIPVGLRSADDTCSGQ